MTSLAFASRPRSLVDLSESATNGVYPSSESDVIFGKITFSFDNGWNKSNRPLQLVRFVVPFQTTWCSLEIYSFVSFKINYSYARKYLRIWKQWFSRVPSRALKWGNKTYKLKRSIFWEMKILAKDLPGYSESAWRAAAILEWVRKASWSWQKRSSLGTRLCTQQAWV